VGKLFAISSKSRFENGIAFTRARPRRKNDQAWIEQKNGAVIRKIAGYDRYEGLTAGRIHEAMAAAATANINNSSIINNTASSFGGGIGVFGATLTLTNTTVSGNAWRQPE